MKVLKDVRVWMASIGLVAAGWLVGPHVASPRAPAVAEESIPRIRYVCTKSGEVFTLPMGNDVLDNPKTGEPTLVPAVFDATRKKWRPGPPLEVMHRRGLLKPAT